MPPPGPDPAEQAAELTRGAEECLPEGALEERLVLAAREGRPLRVKLGIDPTAPDIHLGHVVVLDRLRAFQDAGHVVILIIGDYTARVGDPSGRSSTRPVLSGEEIDRNAATFQDQATRVLDPDPSRLEVRRNSEWLDMPAENLFRLARTATLAQMLVVAFDYSQHSRRYCPQPGGTVGCLIEITQIVLVAQILQNFESSALILLIAQGAQAIPQSF